MSAENKDGNTDGLVYRIVSGSNQGSVFFKIDPQSGEISVAAEGIDRETVAEFTLFVEVVDTRLEPQRYVKNFWFVFILLIYNGTSYGGTVFQTKIACAILKISTLFVKVIIIQS